MSGYKIAEHAFDSFNRYSNESNNLRYPAIINPIRSITYKYLHTLRDGLDVYGNLIENYADFYKQSPIAFKKLIKYACYLDNNPDMPAFAEKLRELYSMVEDFEKLDFIAVLKKYDYIFSAMDWEAARTYFRDNPDAIYAGSRDNLMYSYIKSGEKITRRSTNLGFGSFGRTRVGSSEQLDMPSVAIKRQTNKIHTNWTKEKKIKYASSLLKKNRDELRRQIAEYNADLSSVKNLKAITDKFSNVETEYEQIIDELYWLPRVQKEADFNYDLQVATTGLVIRRNPDGSIYKVYQEMNDIGPNLDSYLQANNPSNEERWEIMIKLLLLGNDLHTGKLSKSGTPYAHRDIKEQNILIDANGDLHFIDFGFSKDHGLDVAHIAHSGTPEYLPISFNNHNYTEALHEITSLRVQETPSYFFDDKVAILRTIFHEAYHTGILNKDVFNSLPKHIWKMIFSHDIDYLKMVDTTNSCKFIAVILIVYSIQPELCTEQYIYNLSYEPDLQESIINTYTQTRKKSRGQNLTTIKKLLLDKEIYLEYLPNAYRIRSNMDISYLQFLLENNLIPEVEICNLTARLNKIIEKSGFDPSLIMMVLNNDVFLDHFLRQATDDDLNIFFDTLNTYNILSPDELTDLHIKALELNIEVPAIQEFADFNEIFYKLTENALLYNSVDGVAFLERFCDVLAYNDDGIEFRPKVASEILCNANIFKPVLTETNEPRTCIINKFIANFMQASIECERSLLTCPTDKNTQEYTNIKEFFAMTVRLYLTINEFQEGILDEESFIHKVEMLEAIYKEDFFNNEAIKSLFYPKDNQVRISPVSTSEIGIFSSSDTDSNTDSDLKDDKSGPHNR